MRKSTWFMLLFIMAVAGLMVFTGCPNGTAADIVVEEPFSFPGELITINAAGDSFEMGDGTYGAYENGNQTDTVTQTISYNFKISRTEITNSQFQQFIEDGGYSTDSYWTTNGLARRNLDPWTEPAYWNNANVNGSNQPVVVVSGYESVAFCN